METAMESNEMPPRRKDQVHVRIIGDDSNATYENCKFDGLPMTSVEGDRATLVARNVENNVPLIVDPVAPDLTSTQHSRWRNPAVIAAWITAAAIIIGAVIGLFKI
jgi:hypothetical protein